MGVFDWGKYRTKTKGHSYFSECPRDDKGHCEPKGAGGEFVSATEVQTQSKTPDEITSELFSLKNVGRHAQRISDDNYRESDPDKVWDVIYNLGNEGKATPDRVSELINSTVSRYKNDIRHAMTLTANDLRENHGIVIGEDDISRIDQEAMKRITDAGKVAINRINAKIAKEDKRRATQSTKIQDKIDAMTAKITGDVEQHNIRAAKIRAENRAEIDRLQVQFDKLDDTGDPEEEMSGEQSKLYDRIEELESRENNADDFDEYVDKDLEAELADNEKLGALHGKLSEVTDDGPDYGDAYEPIDDLSGVFSSEMEASDWGNEPGMMNELAIITERHFASRGRAN